MGIFGTSYSKFTVVGGDTVNLLYSNIVRSEPLTDYVIHKSALLGSQTFLGRGTHWTVEIREHLWKYTTGPTPREQYDAILATLGLKVNLWLHQDGEPFWSDTDGDGTADAATQFTVTEVTPEEVNDTDFKEAVVIKFQSLNPVLQGVFT